MLLLRYSLLTKNQIIQKILGGASSGNLFLCLLHISFHPCVLFVIEKYTALCYNAVNSLIINLGYYGIFYILYRTNTITFDMNTIILMFGFGIVVHYAISLIQEKVMFRKKLKISVDES